MFRRIFSTFIPVCFLAIAGLFLSVFNSPAWAEDTLFDVISKDKVVAAKETPTPDEKAKPDNVEDIRQALEEPTKMDFTETSLSDVIEYLKELHARKHPCFEIKLDMQPLNDLGISPETPISIKVEGITLRSALKLMLRDLGMSYVIRDEVILFTTPEEACYTKVYDVSDIITSQEHEAAAALGSLMKMVNRTCKPPVSSDASKWPGWTESLRSSKLTVVVVNQPEEIQERVAELLAHLRNAKHSK